MSLLSRKQILAALGSERFAVMELSKGLGTTLVSQHIVPVSAAQFDWKPSLDAFKGWLTAANVGRADISIQISNSFVRYAMQPFNETINSEVERCAMAGLLFESIYGESAREWRIALDETHYGEPTLVAAIDGNLALELEQLAESHHCTINWIRPYAASVINAFGKQVQRCDGLLAILDSGQATMFDIKSGRMTGVRKVAVGRGASSEEMAALLRRELLMGGVGGEATKVFLHIAGVTGFKIPQMLEAEIIELQFDESAKRFGTGYEMLGLEELK